MSEPEVARRYGLRLKAHVNGDGWTALVWHPSYMAPALIGTGDTVYSAISDLYRRLLDIPCDNAGDGNIRSQVCPT